MFQSRLRMHVVLLLGSLAAFGAGAGAAETPAPVAPAPATPVASCAGMDPALDLWQRAEQATLARRWPDALADYGLAESALRKVLEACPAQAELARATLGAIPARKAEAEAGIHQSLCLPAINKAFALDNKAATLQLEKKDWADIERLFGQAETAWGEAARDCKGDSRASALANQADSARARSRAALFMGEGAGCDPAFADAGRMLDLAKAAWSERQWEDAGLWYRKAEMAWSMAAEKCAEPKREQALKKKESAVMDAHNAVNCAPLWEKATGLSSKFKALPTAATPAEKAPLHDQVEVAWNEADQACRGAPQEKARGYADAFAKERGNVPLSVTGAPKLLPAVPEGAVAGTPGVEPVVKVPESTAATLPPPSAPVPQDPSRLAVAEAPLQGAFPTSEARGQIPVVNLKAGNTTFSGRFSTDPSRQTVSGEGKVQWDNGNVFIGTLVQGKAEGRGSMRWSNGDAYEGDWKNDLQHGKGSMAYANGDRFEGDFVAGYPAGRGRYLFAASGDRYEGEVRQGKPEGRGTYVWKDGDRYEGGWKAGMKSGAGRYTWASGEVQDGQYANDQRITPAAIK